MVKDLNFLELFRLARIQEAKVSYFSKDPLVTNLYKYIKKIQEGTFSQSDFDECINKELPSIIKYMKSDDPLFTEENIKKALKLDGMLLGYIPDANQTKSICETALAKNGLALGYVSSSLIDDSLAKIALSQNPECKEILIRSYEFKSSSSGSGGGSSDGEYTLDYLPSAKQICLKKNGVTVSVVDASVFMLGSSIESIETETNPSGKPEGTYIKFIIITESGDRQSAYVNMTPLITEIISNELGKKVDKVQGKDLSTNDYTNEDKQKLSGLENYDDTALSQAITNLNDSITNLNTLLEGKVNKESGKSLILDTLINKINNLTKVSQLENDSGYLTSASITEVAYNKTEINNLIKNINQLKVPSTFTVGDKNYQLTIDDKIDELVLTKIITKHLIDENVSITLNKTLFHYGDEVTVPSVEVIYDETLLEEGNDYTIEYLNEEDNTVLNPTEKGDYFVKITGKGWYDGVRREAFKIVD